MTEKVELIPAYFWDCPNCGREMFERSVIAELSPEEEAQMRTACCIEDGLPGFFRTSPEKVTCKVCGETYGTFDWGMND